jgi:hypothetical protein
MNVMTVLTTQENESAYSCMNAPINSFSPALSSVLMPHHGHNPRDVSVAGFPDSLSLQGQLRFLIQYAVLAPSTHNTQPWLFQVSGSSVFLYADRSRALAVADPQVRSLIMSCGAAQFNYESALSAYGFEFRTSLFPEMADADLLVRTDVLRRHRKNIQTDILDAIRSRRTVRTGFRAPLVDGDLRSTLSGVASDGGAMLQWLDMEQVRTLSDVVGRLPGPTEQRQRELEAWRHPNKARSRDGIPGEAPPSFTFFGDPQEDVSIALLSTHGDRMVSWLRAGQALEAVLLSATSHGLRAAMYAIDAIRTDVEGMTLAPGVPQLLVRLGYSDPPRMTNRRSLVDVILHPGYRP